LLSYILRSAGENVPGALHCSIPLRKSLAETHFSVWTDDSKLQFNGRVLSPGPAAALAKQCPDLWGGHSSEPLDLSPQYLAANHKSSYICSDHPTLPVAASSSQLPTFARRWESYELGVPLAQLVLHFLLIRYVDARGSVSSKFPVAATGGSIGEYPPVLPVGSSLPVFHLKNRGAASSAAEYTEKVRPKSSGWIPFAPAGSKFLFHRAASKVQPWLVDETA
jgi:hypothetical protein